MIQSYVDLLNLILIRSAEVSSIAEKMKLVSDLDDLYLAVYERVDQAYERNESVEIIAQLQELEFQIADTKEMVSKRFFGELI